MEIWILIDEAAKLEHPTMLLCLGLQMYMVPWGLKCYGHCPGHVLANNGIIAGCTQSTTFTEIYLHAVLQGFWDRYQTRVLLGQPGANDDPEVVPQTDADMRSFIDDMSMATYGHGPAIYEAHGHMSKYLVRELRNRKGKISTKTTIVGSKYIHQLILQAKYRKLGVKTKIGAAAKDLGLGRTGCLRRTMVGI